MLLVSVSDDSLDFFVFVDLQCHVFTFFCDQSSVGFSLRLISIPEMQVWIKGEQQQLCSLCASFDVVVWSFHLGNHVIGLKNWNIVLNPFTPSTSDTVPLSLIFFIY